MHRAGVRLGIAVAIHGALALIGFAIDHPLVWIGVWIIQAFNLLSFVAILHECAHQHFFTSRRANRLAGTAAAAMAFSNFEVYRAQHILHHAHTCGPNDTEGQPYKFSARWQIVAAFLSGGLLYTAVLSLTGIRVSLGWTPVWLSGAGQRRRVRINTFALFIVFAAAAALAVLDLRSVAFAWLIPVVGSLIGPVPFVLIAEHYDAPGPASAVDNTRTCVSNGLLRFFYLNTNLHTAHHDRPSVPWHALQSHHERIGSRIADDWIFPSYTAFHRYVWRTLRQPAKALS